MSAVTPTTRIPFLNLPEQHQALRQEIQDAIQPLLDGARFVGGETVTTFEQKFGAAHDCDHTVGLKSGTAALFLAMQALDIGPGDEVIVPAFTFIATAAPVMLLGATPIFVDVDPVFACIDPNAVEDAITEKTKLIVAVHLYGHPAAIDELVSLGNRHNLPVLEDCAQSHLSTWNGKKTGSFGVAGTFSFYPSKNLGAAGDAGALTTANEAFAQKVRQLSNHGRTGRYDHAFVGWNERLDALQAAVLTVKLGHLEGWTEERRTAAERYNRLLADVTPFGSSLVLPTEHPDARHVYHLYVIRHPERERLHNALADAEIDTGTHYPTTLPAQSAFAEVPKRHSLPQAEAWAQECLALPLFPGITEEQQTYVAKVLGEL